MSKITDNLSAAWSEDLGHLTENLRRRFDACVADLATESSVGRSDVTLDRRVVLIEKGRNADHWVTVHGSEHDAAQYVHDSDGDGFDPVVCVDLLTGETYEFETSVRARQTNQVRTWS